MGYLVQKTRAASLTIGGQDYTASFVSLQVSDVSAFKNGLITTSGNLILGQRPGAVDIEDYDRNLFKRGTLITLDVQEPGGAAYRHPRGYLYVLGLSYDVEAEQLDVQVGCRLSLAYLTDNAEEVLPLVPVPLDPAQRTIENCSASFASAGMVLYQDNQGSLVSRQFFGADNFSGVEAGDWVSILGETALSVSPLTGAGPIPDTIKLSYQVPSGAIVGDSDAITSETVTTESQYFISYPGITYVRAEDPEDEDSNPITVDVVEPPRSPVTTSGCGTILQPPSTPNNNSNIGEQQGQLCNTSLTTERQTVYLPANKVVVNTSYYLGQGGQQSRSTSVETGPLIEANSQYYADKYAFCKSIYGFGCNPGGGCQYYGMANEVLKVNITEYEYNPDGSLLTTVQDSYETLLSAANPEDWRSGAVDGVIQEFDNDFDTRHSNLYLAQKVITEYSLENNLNIQETTTYASLSTRGLGVSQGAIDLDARRGIKTVVIRRSATNVVNDLRPDTVKSPTTSTSEQSTLINLNTDSYVTPPAVAANYELEESIPVPLLSSNESVINGWVAAYSNYLTRFVKGGLYGLQIGESMRSEIVNGWYPGRPFRYVDNKNNRISALRMDACTWGVTSEEAIVVMNGVWNGFSTGTLSLGNNLVGNSAPDMGALVTNPSINGITSASISVTGSGYADGTYTGVSLTSTEEITSGSIFSSGSGYADGTYTGVSLTSGSGAGAEATIQVVGGAVTSVIITDKGQGYTAGDTLSALDADLGGIGGAGFSYTVDTVGDGTGAEATIKVVNGEIFSVIITDGGQGYAVGDELSALDATLGGGGGAGFSYTVISVDERSEVPAPPTAPPGVSAPPSIVDDVVGQSFSFNVDISLALDSSVFFYGEDPVRGPNPTDLTAQIDLTIIPHVGGLVVAPGGFVETTGTGSIPLETNEGLIVTTSAVIITDDLFGDFDSSAPPIVTGDTQVLLHFNGSLSDSSGLSRTFTAENGATTSTVEAKFGTHSLLVSESGSVSTPADTDTGFDLNTKDFTVEMFLHPTASLSSSLNYEEVLDCAGTGADWWDEAGWQLVTRRSTTATVIEFSWYDDDPLSNQITTFGTTIVDSALQMNSDEWNHLVVQRGYSSGRIAFWLNGRRVYNVVSTAVQENIRSVSDKTSPILRIGANADTKTGTWSGYEGYIDDVRIVTNGIRYDFGAEFITVPTSPLT